MLYKSENRGKTWNVIYPDIKKIAPLEKIQSMSFLPSELVKDMPDGSIDLIKVDPANTNCIFLGLSPLLFSTLGHPKLNNRANFFCSSLISKIWATDLLFTVAFI